MTRPAVVEANLKQFKDYQQFLTSLNSGDRIAEYNRDIDAAIILVSMMREAAQGKIITARVLDVGCGAQMKKDLLCESLGSNYVGIDIIPGFGTYCCSAEEIPDRPELGLFDYVFANHVMEHSPSPGAAVRGISFAAKESGIVGQVTPEDPEMSDPAHLNYLSMDEWKDLYESYGMREVGRRTTTYRGVGSYRVNFRYQVFIQGPQISSIKLSEEDE